MRYAVMVKSCRFLDRLASLVLCHHFLGRPEGDVSIMNGNVAYGLVAHRSSAVGRDPGGSNWAELFGLGRAGSDQLSERSLPHSCNCRSQDE